MSYVYGAAHVGIYCGLRDCCPHFTEDARYPLAASAEAAGMRACMACRPYRVPQTVGRDVPELLCRAVRLIVSGALDQDTEAALAARVGRSGRHLRRLFISHFGITPDALARSSRGHFARRLLDDTDLSITEVAFAAGYGSGRQFNRECRRIFHATPSQLRATMSSSERVAPAGGLTLRLWFTGQLHWDALTGFLAARAVPGVEHVDGQTYRRTVVVNGDPGYLELGPGGPNHLMLRVHLPHWESLMHVTAQARRIAGLDEDVTEPACSLADDPLIRPLLEARAGIRVPGSWDPFEVGVSAILQQRLTSAESRSAMECLVRRLGRPVPSLAAARLSHTFPTPGALAGAETGLQAAGMAEDHITTLMAFASAVEQGVIRLDGSTSSEQLINSLQAIPGMTASTAHYVALRMGEPDVFPADDRTLQHTLSRLTARPSPALSRKWQPWRSYAAALLWAAA
jgi:AraC family transcriptional regulator of adaptative response / DNA-3-methyladenine glycosylase II